LSAVTVHQSKTADWQSHRRNYRALLRTKRDVFWRSQAEASYSRPRELWSTFDSILHRGRTPVSNAIDASALYEFFDHKVDAIRDATCADPPTFTSVPYDCDLSTFGTVTADDVITATRRLSDKQCTTDILPTWLFKLCAAELKQRSAG